MYSFLLVKSEKKKKNVINKSLEGIYAHLTHYFELSCKANYFNTLNICWFVIKTAKPWKQKLFCFI